MPHFSSQVALQRMKMFSWNSSLEKEIILLRILNKGQINIHKVTKSQMNTHKKRTYFSRR